jgi:drug/metabolite transporter (DMT)-like permease
MLPKLLMSLKIQKHQWVGSSIYIVGLCFVVFTAFYFDEQSTENAPSKLCRTKLLGTLWCPFDSMLWVCGFVLARNLQRALSNSSPDDLERGNGRIHRKLNLIPHLGFYLLQFWENCVFDAYGNPFM